MDYVLIIGSGFEGHVLTDLALVSSYPVLLLETLLPTYLSLLCRALQQWQEMSKHSFIDQISTGSQLLIQPHCTNNYRGINTEKYLELK